MDNQTPASKLVNHEKMPKRRFSTRGRMTTPELRDRWMAEENSVSGPLAANTLGCIPRRGEPPKLISRSVVG